MSRERKTQAGFSLVELMVAMLILAVGLLGLVELQVMAMKTNLQSGSMVVATSLAQSTLEEVVAMDNTHSEWASLATAVTDRAWPDGTGVAVAGAGTYDITFSTEPTFQGVTSLCQVTVKVVSLENVTRLGGGKR